jgi:hypothetical protein
MIMVLAVTAVLAVPTNAQQSALSQTKVFIASDGAFQVSYPGYFQVCTQGKVEPCIQSYIPVCEQDALTCVVYPAQRFEG